MRSLLFLGALALPSAQAAYPPTVVTGATLVAIHTSANHFYEGPSWDPIHQQLLFTEPPASKIFAIAPGATAALWMDPSLEANGTFVTPAGKLLVAQGGAKRITEFSFGSAGLENPTVRFESSEVLKPNDVVQRADGVLYFTDPDFSQGSAGSAVWVVPVSGAPRKLLGVNDIQRPNGLGLTLDESHLIIGDSQQKCWFKWQVLPDGSLTNKSLFFQPTNPNTADPDGLTVDEQGNFYLTGRGAVWCVREDGTALGSVPVPEFCSNVAFGGVDGRTLYITCQNKVYSLAMNVAGREGPVPAPAISPASGSYDMPQIVELSGAGPIHFTTNGAPASESSPVYTGPFVVGPGQSVTVRAIGKRPGRMAMELQATIEVTAPVANPTTGSATTGGEASTGGSSSGGGGTQSAGSSTGMSTGETSGDGSSGSGGTTAAAVDGPKILPWVITLKKPVNGQRRKSTGAALSVKGKVSATGQIPGSRTVQVEISVGSQGADASFVPAKVRKVNKRGEVKFSARRAGPQFIAAGEAIEVLVRASTNFQAACTETARVTVVSD